jgi:hypothetical protein
MSFSQPQHATASTHIFVKEMDARALASIASYLSRLEASVVASLLL